MNWKRIGLGVFALIIIVISVIYLIPTPSQSFQEIYTKVDRKTASSLQTFRQNNPVKSIEVDGVKWLYIAVGQGDETILFLHGMTGAYDIWWQQIDALQNRYRIISLTYPAVDSLAG